jgi:hypothetical protein
MTCDTPSTLGALVLEPIAGLPVLNLGQFDVRALGYEVEEFFMSGTAKAFKPTKPLTNAGNWEVTVANRGDFTTRLVVVRPRDVASFNGTVIVEWLNVSGGVDAAPDWLMLHREILRSGYAYVAISAQRVGIEGGGASLIPPMPALKQLAPQRYGSLLHPGDEYAFDMFNHVGEYLKRSPRELLGALVPDRMLAVGESQSAMYLTTYINAIDPLACLYDGYLIHSRFGNAAPLRGHESSAAANDRDALRAVRFRDSLRVPVMNLLTETDVLVQGPVAPYFDARQPDTERLRTWEIAGAAHADTYLFSGSNIDSGSTPAAMLAMACAAAPLPMLGIFKLINSAPQHHYVAASALAHLHRWARQETPPPSAEPLIVATPTSFAYDVHGNARGGVRTPWMEVPTAQLSGLGNVGGSIGFLVGTTVPFDAGTLRKLYPNGKEEYCSKFATALQEAIRKGFLLPADAAESQALAAAMYPLYG